MKPAIVGLDLPLEGAPPETLPAAGAVDRLACALAIASSSAITASPNGVPLAPGPHRALPWDTCTAPM